MQHHIIKSLLFSASLSKVHWTFFTLALGVLIMAPTANARVSVGLAMITASAQEANFTIEGKKLPRQCKNGTTIYLLDRQTWDSIGSATVSKGKFSIEGHTDTVFMGWITDRRHLYFPVVVEPGKTVSLNARDFIIEGSPLNDQLNRYVNGYLRFEKTYSDADDIASAVKEGSWLYNKANETIAACLDSINSFNNVTGWQIYNDNADNVVGAWILYHYFDRFVIDGDYYSDTISLRRHILDSIYSSSSLIVRDFKPTHEKYKESIRQKAVAKGNRFSDFTGVHRTTNDTVRLSQLIDGHVAVVDFWASWCGPCRQEITDCLKPLYEQYADSGLVIVGVGVWDKMEDFERAVMDLSISYTQIIDTTKTVPTLYGFNSIPQLFLIDRDGTLLGNYRGEELVREVEKALKKEDN